LPIRKAMLGKRVCFTRAPVYPATFNLVTRFVEARRGHFNLELKYKGIRGFEKRDIVDKILQFGDVADFVVWDREDRVLLGYEMMRVILRTHTLSLQKGSQDYEVTLSMEELL